MKSKLFIRTSFHCGKMDGFVCGQKTARGQKATAAPKWRFPKRNFNWFVFAWLSAFLQYVWSANSASCGVKNIWRNITSLSVTNPQFVENSHCVTKSLNRSLCLCLCLKTLQSKVAHLVSEWHCHLWSCLWQLKRLKRRLWLNLCFLFPVNHRNNIVHRRGNYLIINSPKNHHTFNFMLQNGNIYPNDEKIQLRKWGWWLNWNLWRKAQKLWNGF